jgi:molybdopterin-containing oxidoreductase family membrane subunit
MSTVFRPEPQPPVIAPGEDALSVTRSVSGVVLKLPIGLRWMGSLGFAVLLTGIFLVGICWLLYAGVGIWGLNIPVAWAFAITN